MEQFELKAEKRTIIGKRVKALRRDGLIPAVLYGSKTEPTPIQCDGWELQRVLAGAGGTNLISVRIGAAGKPKMALAREVQRDAITNELYHVDFYQVVMTEKVSAEVNIIFTGESPIVQQADAMLLQGADSVEIECLPGDLIHSIEVDLSTLLEIDDAIYVKDLQVPENITILTDGDELVAKVQHLYIPEEVEEEEWVEAAPEEVEVIAKGKELEEAAEEAEPAGETE